MSRVQEIGQWLTRYAPPRLLDFMVGRYSARRSRAKFGPRFQEHLDRLRQTQWYGPEEIDALQDSLLREMVHYATTHVPYWRQLFRELELRPDDIRTAADLRLLPILEKSTIRAQPDAFRSELYPGGKGVELFKTSGTTGEALQVAIDADALKLEKAFTWLHREWGGFELGDPHAAFVGFSIISPKRTRPPYWALDRAENRLMFSLQHMSPATMRLYGDALVCFQPRAIYGYPTALYLMALWLREEGIRSVRPSAVFTASETLLPHYRAVMEEAFGCRVLDWYGATEFIANITQCEEGRYHVKQEYGVVELLGDDGEPAVAGEPGALVGTGLNNRAMPFFRYRVGDVAVAGSGVCPCGRAGRLVDSIVGRTEDVVVTPDGRYISRLDFIFKTIQNVREAQLVQERVDHLRVRVVPRPGFGAADEEQIRANLRDRLGDAIRIQVERVDEIPRLPSGKFRYVISKVPLEFGGARQAGEALGLSAEEDTTL